MNTSNEKLRDDYIRRQQDMLRYARHVESHVIRTIAATEPELKSLVINGLIDVDDVLSPDNRKKLKILEDKIKDLRTGAWAESSTYLDKEMLQYMSDESVFISNAISRAVVYETVTQIPTLQRVKTILKHNPFEGRVLSEHVQKLATDDYNRLLKGIRGGVINGDPVNKIARDLVRNSSIDKKNVQAVTRTAVNSFANTIRQDTYKQNADIIKKEIYIATLDSRTTMVCMGYDGRIYNIGEGPIPPIHYSCFTGDTNVSTCSNVSLIYKRAYKGRLIDITTKSRRSISVTPNHPILTSKGWKAAEMIDLTDKLVCVNDLSVINENYKNNVTSKFSELFSSVNIMSDPSLVTNRPTTPEDFHGDITDPDVDIISVERSTWNSVREELTKGIIKERLPSGLRPILCKDPSYCSIANAEDLPDLFNSHSVNGTEFDDVVNITIRENVSCHVYNLENKDNWYVANGVIVHNCRSIRSPYIAQHSELFNRPVKEVTKKQTLREFTGQNNLGNIKNRKDLPRGYKTKYDEYERKRARELTGRVPAKTTYDQFLRKQSVEYQQDVLGVKKAKLYREGDVPISKFTDKDGTPLTLEQLQERESTAWNKVF